ncbi:MAG TPA: hypothetical protein VGN37_19115 [Actinocatenispora sp.]
MTGPGSGTRTDDPLLPHLVWEAVLFVIALVSVAVLLVSAPTGAPILSNFLLSAGVTGLLATGVAASMRTATPNLAAGAISSGAGLLTARLVSQSHWSLLAAGLVAVVAATLTGVLLGGIAGALSVPGWAVTFGAAIAIQGLMVTLTQAGSIPMVGVPLPFGGLWFTLFLLVSLGGGAVWLVPAVRRTLGSTRRVGDAAQWGGVAAFGALAGVSVSSLLAGLSGVVTAQRIQAGMTTDTSTLSFALGAVLLGGVSVFGRRAGVAGTALAVVTLTAIQTTMILKGASSGAIAILAAAAIVLGLPVSRLMETIAGRMPARRTVDRTPVAGPPAYVSWPGAAPVATYDRDPSPRNPAGGTAHPAPPQDPVGGATHAAPPQSPAPGAMPQPSVGTMPQGPPTGTTAPPTTMPPATGWGASGMPSAQPNPGVRPGEEPRGPAGG